MVVQVSVTSQPTRLVYHFHLDMCQLVLPFFDLFKVILTTSGFYNFRKHKPKISAWYLSYVRSFVGFVPDVAKRVIQTSAGAIVNPDADNVMRTTSYTYQIPYLNTWSMLPAVMIWIPCCALIHWCQCKQ